MSRRQALLLGAGSLAASTFASPLSATADTPAVAAAGIKSVETVQLGQSGLSSKIVLWLLWSGSPVKLLCTQACRSVQLELVPGAGVTEQVCHLNLVAPKKKACDPKVVFYLVLGYWGYGNEYQKEDNLDAYKAVVGNGISFIDTSEVCFACFLATQSCHARSSTCELSGLSCVHSQPS